MRPIFKTAMPLVFCTLFATTSLAIAADKKTSETAGITEAVDLYAQAIPMDMGAPQRQALLNKAESILVEVIDSDPNSLDAHRKLMGVYLQMRDYPKAIQTIQDAISLSPEDPKLFVALAILYDHQGAYEYAIPVLDQALALDPGQQLAQDYKAEIQRKMKIQRLAMESTPSAHKIAVPESR